MGRTATPTIFPRNFLQSTRPRRTAGRRSCWRAAAHANLALANADHVCSARGIVGAGSLSYRTSRVRGRSTDRSVTIPLSGSNVPQSLERIDLVIGAGGAETRLSFPPQPNQSYRFTWDGKDSYGREVQGAVPVNAQVRYIYTGIYTVTRVRTEGVELNPALGFGIRWFRASSIDRSIVRRTRVALAHSQSVEVRKKVGSWDARGAGLGGWTLGDHHVYDHSTRTLQNGSGDRRGVQSIAVFSVRCTAAIAGPSSFASARPRRR